MKDFKKIYVEITNVCNLSCSFCSDSKKTNGYMSVLQFEEIARKIQPHTRYVYLHVKGEPLLHQHLDNILDICAAYRLHVVLVTNGTFLAQKGEMLLQKTALRQVNISMHCISELKQEARKVEYLKSVIDFAKKVRAHSHLYISFRLWNFKDVAGNATPETISILTEIENEFAPGTHLITSFTPGKGFKLTDRLYLNSDVEFTWPTLNDVYQSSTGFCHALRDHVAILNNGTVVPCCLDADGNINLGNIFDNNLQEILQSERARNMYQNFSDNKRAEELCLKCRFTEKFE